MTDPAVLAHLTSLAVDEDKVTPGLLGFVVFAVLGAATWFLLKNMNKQFKKVDFVEEPEQDDAPAAPGGRPEDSRTA
ncbi:hypothetical protein LO771_26095 [Streptacidiphilus sp. ASG 303]|nr:hypothetical protein [Streptacidiphilus sp. ASG 303]MCD0485766.1 hypothetical protein [Streptacidiphilus sp. ASG 303]